MSDDWFKVFTNNILFKNRLSHDAELAFLGKVMRTDTEKQNKLHREKKRELEEVKEQKFDTNGRVLGAPGGYKTWDDIKANNAVMEERLRMQENRAEYYEEKYWKEVEKNKKLQEKVHFYKLEREQLKINIEALKGELHPQHKLC